MEIEIKNFFITNQIPLDRKFLVAASGGPDSMALVDLLRQMGVDLAVAHLDHQMREGSEQESVVLQDYCTKYNLPLYETTWPKSAHPQNGLEAAARDYRYAFLEKMADKIGARYLLTAHHGDDLLENIMIKFLRSGIPREMASLKAVSHRKDLIVLRPLLPYGKADLLAYVEKKNIPYVVDQTNSEAITVRNRLRKQVIPLLKAENPDLIKNALRFSQEVGATEAFLARQTRSLPDFTELLGAIRIDQERMACDLEIEKAYLEDLIEKKYNERVQLNRALLAAKKAQEKGGLRIQFYQQYCWIYPVKEIAEQKQQSIKLDHPFVFQGRSFQLTVEKAAGSKAKKLVAVLPLKKKMDKEIENISFGSLPVGQKVLLPDGHHAKNKKLFAEKGIPSSLRSRCLAMMAGQEVLFIEHCYQLREENGSKMYLYELDLGAKERSLSN